jgi:hypothetical protein
VNVPGHGGVWVQVPDQAVAWACQADPELAPTLLALASLESGFNPQAVRNTACPNLPGYRDPGPYQPELSVGLLQFNVCGGLGGSACCSVDQASLSALMDPVYNLSQGARYIRSRLAQGASLYDALSPWVLSRDILLRSGFLSGQTENPCTGGPSPTPGSTPGPGVQLDPDLVVILGLILAALLILS